MKNKSWDELSQFLWKFKYFYIVQCSRKSSDTSDISDGLAQMSDERFNKFE